MFNQKVILDILSQYCPDLECHLDLSLSNFTYMKVGGKAKIMIFPNSLEQLIKALSLCLEKNILYFIIGKGSNLIVNDEGVDALFINTKNLSRLELKNPNSIVVQAGVELKNLSTFACQNGLGGLEFSSGIPGSVGGAIYMNAGAYGGEMKDVVLKTLCFMPNKGVIELNSNEQEFGYRTSIFAKKGGIVLETTLKLEKRNIVDIQNQIDDLTKQRESKQPLDLPSAGSVFKRPEGYFAGKLITDAGLKGYRIGGAAVSEKHAGFIVNIDNAKAQDILDLITHIQNEVFNQFGVMLEPEVKFLEKDGSFRKF